MREDFGIILRWTRHWIHYGFLGHTILCVVIAALRGVLGEDWALVFDLIFFEGQAGFFYSAPATVQRDRVGVAHFLQIVGYKSAAKAAAAVEHDGR